MDSVGVDIGGTKIAVGVVDSAGTILAKVRRPTRPQDPTSIDGAIADAVAELSTRYDVRAVGLAAAGFASSDRNHMNFAPNIAWRDYPLGDNVRSLLGREDVTVHMNQAAKKLGERLPSW